jgi:hypothetical protein
MCWIRTSDLACAFTLRLQLGAAACVITGVDLTHRLLLSGCDA